MILILKKIFKNGKRLNKLFFSLKKLLSFQEKEHKKFQNNKKSLHFKILEKISKRYFIFVV